MADSLAPYAAAYKTPAGPGDARPTALQVLKDNDQLGKWGGRVVLVTGGTSGIGVETARAMHAAGADVYITARDMQKGLGVAEDIRKSNQSSGGNVDVVLMDMDSLDSVKNAARDFLAKSSKLNVLINNAGVMGTPQSKTADGFERQFGVNHLAHFTLTALLLPALLASSTPTFNSRVVNVSSSGHRFSPIVFDDVNLEGKDAYEPWRAYGQSKTANIWFANHIDRLYGHKGVHALAAHPGGVWSPLYVHVPESMAKEWQDSPDLMKIMQTPEQGASTSVWAAAGKVWEGHGGKYLAECAVGPLDEDTTSFVSSGHAPYAYDPEGEKKLWDLSVELTGVQPPLP